MVKTIFYSLAALVRKILFCHSKVKFTSSLHRLISSIYTYLGPFRAEPENVTHAPIVKGSKAASGNLGRATPKPKQDGQGYRRKRTAFSIRQLQKLETAFRWNMYPGVNVRKSLATELGISEACVQVRSRQFLTLKGICDAICYLYE